MRKKRNQLQDDTKDLSSSFLSLSLPPFFSIVSFSSLFSHNVIDIPVSLLPTSYYENFKLWEKWREFTVTAPIPTTWIVQLFDYTCFIHVYASCHQSVLFL